MRAPLFALALAAAVPTAAAGNARFVAEWLRGYQPEAKAEAPRTAEEADFLARVARAALAQAKGHVRYDPRYVKLAYPGGDVPPDRGVCSDVLVRAYRAAGVDLQVVVHEDEGAAHDAYPWLWGVRKPDANIDHRRVPNLMVFFRRHGRALPITARATDYRPGDVVAWDLGGGVTHIGLVAAGKDAKHPLIVHNIGAGPKLEDVLFAWRVIGHFVYAGEPRR